MPDPGSPPVMSPEEVADFLAGKMLTYLDAQTDKWAAEVSLPASVANVARMDKVAIESFVRQCFAEGFHRGIASCDAAANRRVAAALEQVAKVADGIGDDPPSFDRPEHWGTGWQDGAMEVAAAIRALIKPEGS